VGPFPDLACKAANSETSDRIRIWPIRDGQVKATSFLTLNELHVCMRQSHFDSEHAALYCTVVRHRLVAFISIVRS
jgi:hypothetical protein